ncbi:trihelix transcription factor ASR3-like [Triticum dicoccoides]|uniref:trihelix transcription factor ASR3-like n=1 Tax=Triticum dicoccoides TaxID=85692 RepID=UPI00162B6D3C|nr:trihelix transcription factor ASR3-like [Triticum dicoccoides]
MDAKGSGGAHREGEETGNVMAGAMTVAREYRRGNWTLPETMLLIEAKKRVHSERHPADLGLGRWRWVEDYCWRAGCRRSQNQCNDRWDNLMRDYKKVRAYGEHAGAGAEAPRPSYWEMARAERKARYLPSNLLREIYEAMAEIVERRTGFSGAGGPFLGAPPPPMASTGLVGVPMQASPLAQVQPRPLDQEETRCSSESSPERKRLRLSLDGQPGSSRSTPASAAGHNDRHQEPQGDDREISSDDAEEHDELSGAIGQCAAILSGALESREAAEERRHREVMAVEERRSVARQARREAGEQCMAGLAAAVGQLAGSMLALAAKHEGPAAPK